LHDCSLTALSENSKILQNGVVQTGNKAAVTTTVKSYSLQKLQ